MIYKLIAAALYLVGGILLIGGVVAIIQAERNAPMFYAMLAAIAAYGVGCIVAATAILRNRPLGFMLCFGMGLGSGLFALYVSEPVGQGMLWPVSAVMAAIGVVGRLATRRRAE